MPNKTIGLKKIAMLALCVFAISSVSLFVVEEIVFLRLNCYIDIACYLWRIGHGYIYYWAVYLIISFVYSICFYYVLRLNKIENLRKISRHLYMIVILFVSGWALYTMNKYYWQIWSGYDFWERLLIISLNYLYFLIMQSIFIVFWIISSALVTYFIALDKETKALSKRPLLILLALCAIFLGSFAFIDPFKLILNNFLLSILFLASVIIFCIYKKIKSRRTLRIQQRPSGEANASVSATSDDLNATTVDQREINTTESSA